MFSLHPHSLAAPSQWWVHGQPQDQIAVKTGSFLEAALEDDGGRGGGEVGRDGGKVER